MGGTWRGTPWGGPDLGKKTSRRGPKRGMKGCPWLSDLRRMSPSCRVSHGIAGTLLGEMALCAKKRPPGKTGAAGGLVSLGSSRLGVTMAQGAEGGGTTGTESGGAHPGGSLGGQVVSRMPERGSRPRGAEYLPLTSRGTRALSLGPGALRFHLLCSLPPPRPPVFLQAGAGCKRLPGQHWRPPRGRGSAVFAYAALAGAALRAGGGRGAEPGRAARSGHWARGRPGLGAAAAGMAGAAGGARARRPGLPSQRPRLLRLPGGPPHPRR